MTKVDLQRVLDLDAQATAGPWEAFEDSNFQPAGCPPVMEWLVSANDGIGQIIDWGNHGEREDAELIAHYRTAAPAMAKALKAVLGAIEVLSAVNPGEPVLLNALGILESFIEKHLGEQP